MIDCRLAQHYSLDLSAVMTFHGPMIPLVRRPYLSSMWPHEEARIDKVMMHHSTQLLDMMKRYGVSKDTLCLNSLEYDDAMTAWNDHLHVLSRVPTTSTTTYPSHVAFLSCFLLLKYIHIYIIYMISHFVACVFMWR